MTQNTTAAAAENLHETAEHLFCIFRRPGIGKADECTIDCCPGTPFQLKDKSTTYSSNYQV